MPRPASRRGTFGSGFPAGRLLLALAVVAVLSLLSGTLLAITERAEGARPIAQNVRATVLRTVHASLEDGAVNIVLGGNGKLEPSSVTETEDLPHRLVLDFERVASTAPAMTVVGQGSVLRVRVGQNSRTPPKTRVVVDLDTPAPYRIESTGADGHDVRVIVGSSVDERALTSPVATSGPVELAEPLPPPPLESVRLGIPAAPSEITAGSGFLVNASRSQMPAAGQSTPATSPERAQAGTGTSPVGVPQVPLPSSPSPDPRLQPGQTPPTEAPAPSGTTEPQTPATPAAPSRPAPGPAGLAALLINPSQSSASAGQAPQRSYSGHPVSLDFQNADLRAVLRTFSEISGLNLVIDPAVNGSVDVTLRDVPWDQALDLILRANKLGYVVDGTVVRIAPLAVLADEEAQRRKLAEEQALAGELNVITLPLSYARAEDIKPLLTRSALTQRGEVEVDARTNTLIIRDLPAALATASGLIATLDKPQPQVEIEARIVQTNRDFARSIGVQWGFSGRAAPDLGNTLPLAFPNQGSVTGRVGGVQSPPNQPADSSATAVNLGVQAASSAIGISLGSVNGAINLDVALSALERSGKGRLLSTPRVSTQNNVEAEVTQGVQIPIQTVANNTVTVSFKDAALTLKVTPQITAAGTVIMKISLENATPDFTRAVNGIPPINTQRANTQVLVNDAQTTVIGGIYVSSETTHNDRTPGLYNLPLLG